MRHAYSPAFQRIGKALHAQYDDITKQPLPKRWVDLINYLNEKERMERGSPQPEPEPRPYRPRSN